MTPVMDLVQAFDLKLKRTSGTHGGEYTGYCPCCGGRSDGKRTDRFHVWPEQREGDGTYWCRICGIKGDSIQFVMDTQNLPFPDAARLVGADLKNNQTRAADSNRLRPIPGFKPAHPDISDPTKAVSPDPNQLWTEKAGKLVEYAAGHLAGSPGETVLKSKGITLETADRCRLGWLPETWYRPRSAWGAPESLKEDGTPKKLWLPEGLVIPLLSHDGQAVKRLRIRRDGDQDLRYYVVPGSSMAQMILGPQSASRCVCVVESELDAILISQECAEITRVVSMGNSTTKPDTATDSVLKQAARILVSLDNDPAGKSASAWWLATYPRAVMWPVPTGKDPSDAWQDGVNLRQWLMDGWPEGWKIVSQKKKPDHAATTPEPNPTSSSPVRTNPVAQNQTNNPIDPVDELYWLMKRHPKIGIINSDNRLSIDIYETFQQRYPSDYTRLITLLYQSNDVMDYLDWRGLGRINSANFFTGES